MSQSLDEDMVRAQSQQQEPDALLGSDAGRSDDFFANAPNREGRHSTIVHRVNSFSESNPVDQVDNNVAPNDDQDEMYRLGDANDVDSNADVDSLQHEGGSHDNDNDNDSQADMQGGGQLPGIIQSQVQMPVQAQAPALLPGVQRPDTQLTSEPDNNYRYADWKPNRADRVLGQYWRTFGERKKQAGFFGALFGNGMARANRALAKRNFATNQLTRARALRAEQRQADAIRGPLRSALKTRLQNPSRIEDLSTFPREPGIAYDEAAAGKSHKRYMNARKAFHDVNEGGVSDPLAGDALRKVAEARIAEADIRMKIAHAPYDETTGTRTLFGGALRDGPDEKASALSRANITSGAEKFRLESQQRRTPQRVRFADGANDTVGLPVNDPNENYTNKPMPTRAHFFAAPIGARTLGADAKKEMQREQAKPGFRALTPGQQEAKNQEMKAAHRSKIEAYVNAGGRMPHKDHITDAQAIQNEMFAWPIRSAMSRMRSTPLMKAAGTHQVNAMRRAMAIGEDNVTEDDEFKDQYIRSGIADDVIAKRTATHSEDEKKAEKRRFKTAGLTDPAQRALKMQLGLQGHQFTDEPLPKQMPQLPRGYFDGFFESAYAAARAGRPVGPRRVQDDQAP